jgi:FixJ family two-component response regulator
VKVHRSHLMKKMGARSVADLVRMAEALGVTPVRSQR